MVKIRFHQTQGFWTVAYFMLFHASCSLHASLTTEAFIIVPQTQPHHATGRGAGATATTTTTRLFMAENQEKILRETLAERNTVVENEGQYVVADGEFLDRMETADVTATAAVASNDDKNSLSARMERLTKPRAYPLFLAEKAAEIVEATVDGLRGKSDDQQAAAPAPNNTDKERVVVLGTGWGAASFLKGIDTGLYDVTVVSPRNYFLFTPMLAGASVGTYEYRSITEPVREINRNVGYLEATATEIDAESKQVTCQAVVCDGSNCEINEFTLPFHRLIVSVGAQTNTFGIPGVRENCFFLKQVEDARRIRTAIVNCFERSNLPGLTDEEREQNLTFCVIGAGPTGIEFAAELRDFIEQDGPKYYPELLKHVRIKVIEASSTVLAPFDKSLQEEAIQQLYREVNIKDPKVSNLLPERFQLTELFLDSSVKEVTPLKIDLTSGQEIPYGIAVWAAGNGPIPLTLQLIDALGDAQAAEQDVARGRIAVDPWMRAVGGRGEILAFGDCACSVTQQLPATAQVASQQGEYLANIMNRKYQLSPEMSQGIFPPPTKDPEKTKTAVSDAIANFATSNKDGEYAKPFQFLNLGILAYTGGGSALAQVTTSPNAPPVKGTGAVGNAVWRSVYLSKQVSWRNRLLVMNDWIRRQIFGRDITRL